MGYKNKIICGDCLDLLKQVPDDVVSLTITSPPYNLSIKYGTHSDNLPYSKYLVWLKNIFSEIFRVTKNGGRVAINIDAMTNRQDDKDDEYIRPIYAHLYNLMKEIGWKFRTEICWYKQNAVGRKTAWGSWLSPSNPIIRRNHEYILIWSKGDWKLDGDKNNIDITENEFKQWTFSTWFIQPETRNLGGHPAPFPEELVKRLLKLFSYRNDIILDPFNGIGTTSYIAKLTKRNYLGFDIDKKYCEYAQSRVDNSIDLFDLTEQKLDNNKDKHVEVNLF